MLKRLRIVLLVGLLSAVASPARAYHSSEQKLYDETAYSLAQGELSLGVRRLAVGVFDALTLSTQTLTWFMGLPAGTVIPNIEARVRLFQNDTWAVALSGSFLFAHVQPDNPAEASFSGILAPITATASLRWDDTWTTSLSTAYTFSRVTAGTPPSESGDVTGAAVVSSLQVFGTIEMRQSKVLSLTFTGRLAPYIASLPLSGTASLDELTTVTLDARVELTELKYAAAFEVAANMSWRSLNLKLGLGYGSLFLPGTGLLVPGQFPVPVLDLYWRF